MKNRSRLFYVIGPMVISESREAKSRASKNSSGLYKIL